VKKASLEHNMATPTMANRAWTARTATMVHEEPMEPLGLQVPEAVTMVPARSSPPAVAAVAAAAAVVAEPVAAALVEPVVAAVAAVEPT
jgi:hypothetical protein